MGDSKATYSHTHPRPPLSGGAVDETNDGVSSEGGVALGVRGADGRAHREVVAARLGYGTRRWGSLSLAIGCRQRVYAHEGKIPCGPTGGQTKNRLVNV